MKVAHLPSSARFLGSDLFDKILYYETSRFCYTFVIKTKEVRRYQKSVLNDIQLK